MNGFKIGGVVPHLKEEIKLNSTQLLVKETEEKINILLNSLQEKLELDGLGIDGGNISLYTLTLSSFIFEIRCNLRIGLKK